MYKKDGTKVEVSEPSITAALKLGWTDTAPTQPKANKNVKNRSNTGK